MNTSEDEHLAEIILSLNLMGKHYFSCQVSHLALLLRQQAYSLIPVLRFGYLISKDFLPENEAIKFVIALFEETRRVGKGEGRCPVLELLNRSKDLRWLVSELRKVSENFKIEFKSRHEEVKDEFGEDHSRILHRSQDTGAMSASTGISA